MYETEPGAVAVLERQGAPVEGGIDVDAAILDMEFGFDQTAPEVNYGAPAETAEAYVPSDELINLRLSVGAILMSVGTRIGDEQLVADANTYNETTRSLRPDMFLAMELLREEEDRRSNKR